MTIFVSLCRIISLLRNIIIQITVKINLKCFAITNFKERLTMMKLRPDMDIGKNIQRLRQKTELTQDQTIAHMHLMGLNISKSTYAKLETNRMNIRVSELVALKIIFNAEFNDFFLGLEFEQFQSN